MINNFEILIIEILFVRFYLKTILGRVIKILRIVRLVFFFRFECDIVIIIYDKCCNFHLIVSVSLCLSLSLSIRLSLSLSLALIVFLYICSFPFLTRSVSLTLPQSLPLHVWILTTWHFQCSSGQRHAVNERRIFPTSFKQSEMSVEISDESEMRSKSCFCQHSLRITTHREYLKKIKIK